MVLKNVEENIVQQFYTNIFDQCIFKKEGCGVAINSLGEILLFSLLEKERNVLRYATQKRLLCMRKSDEQIFCGDSKGNLNIFNWRSLYEQFNQMTTTTTSTKDSFLTTSTAVIAAGCSSCSEINDILIMNNGEKIAIGCGNGDIVTMDVEYIKKNNSLFQSHTKQINRLTKRNEYEFASCSNDGYVYLWDTRVNNKKPTKCLNISSSSAKHNKNNFSAEIYALACDDDFVVCGGGPNLPPAIWHISSESQIQELKNDNNNNSEMEEISPSFLQQQQQNPTTAIEMHDGQILIGNSCLNGLSTLKRFNYSGQYILSLNILLKQINNISTDNLNSSALTLLAGRSSTIYFVSNYGFISGSVNIF